MNKNIKNKENIISNRNNNSITKSYIHVDSRRKIKKANHEYSDPELISFDSLIFSKGSSIIKIKHYKNDEYESDSDSDSAADTDYDEYFDTSDDRINGTYSNIKKIVESFDSIMFKNITNDNIILENALNIKIDSNYARIKHYNHGISLGSTYDNSLDSEFVILDKVDYLPNKYDKNKSYPDTNKFYKLLNPARIYTINMTITDSDKSPTIIPYILNGLQQIILIFYKGIDGKYYSDPDSYLVELPVKSNFNYENNGKIYLRLNNVCDIPLDYLNNNKFDIIRKNKNNFLIDIGLNVIDNIETKNIIRPITIIGIKSIEENNLSNNNYVYVLDRKYSNVISSRLISTIIPNIQRTLSENNNKLYIKNYDDCQYIYQISLIPGNYSMDNLISHIENVINSTPIYNHTDQYNINPDTKMILNSNNNTLIDQNYFDINGIYKFLLTKIIADIESDTISFSFYKMINIENKLTAPYNMLTIEPNYNLDIIMITPDTIINILDNKYIPGLDNLINVVFKKSIGNEYVATSIPILVNYSDKIYSLETNTLIDNYAFDNGTNVMTILNHSLPINSIIITDKINNKIESYTVSNIIDNNNFVITLFNKPIIWSDILIGLNNETQIKNMLIEPKYKNGDIELLIYHHNHRLRIGDIVEISGSNNIGIIPKKYINRMHKIVKIIDNNNYAVIINNVINFLEEDYLSNRGLNILIKFPSYSQLYFNYPDTVGNILGFYEPGNQNSITKYGVTISNRSEYINDLIDKRFFVNKKTHNPKIKTSGEDYIYLCCDELAPDTNMLITGTGDISNVYSIINLEGGKNTINYNTFVDFEHKYYPAIKNINKLHISFKNYDGSYVDFDNSENSMVIEIIEMVEGK